MCTISHKIGQTFIKCVYGCQNNKNCLILTSHHVPKLNYRAHAQKCKPLLHGTESSSMTILKYLVYRLNTTSEF